MRNNMEQLKAKEIFPREHDATSIASVPLVPTGGQDQTPRASRARALLSSMQIEHQSLTKNGKAHRKSRFGCAIGFI